jgi:hypothetical protein
MNQESDDLARAACQLAEEIEAGHKAVMAVEVGPKFSNLKAVTNLRHPRGHAEGVK